MGGVVSTGRDNDDLVDNLKEAEYIKSEKVEQVFRIVDRAHYYLAECRESAYKDLAWRNGALHLSAPCIYSEVMEALDLKKGLSFLNLGSGTGYLNTMVGFVIGPYGINHGIELHESNITFAEQRLKEFNETSPRFDDLELCEPQFVEGNCLNLAPDNRRYDRVYCGAGCPMELLSTVQNIIKVTGILVVPVGDQLLKITRLSETDFESDNVLPVSFASLVQPSTPKGVQDMIVLPEINPLSLQDICRLTIRDAIRRTFTFDKHLPGSSNDLSKPGKHILIPRVFRQEHARYPLNILPTRNGLVIMGGVSDESDESDESENLDDELLDQQLQHHALKQRQAAISDVDSHLSEEDEDGPLGGADTTKDESTESKAEVDGTGAQKRGRSRPPRSNLEAMESEDGVAGDDEAEFDDPEFDNSEDRALLASGAIIRMHTSAEDAGNDVNLFQTTYDIDTPGVIPRQSYVQSRQWVKPRSGDENAKPMLKVITTRPTPMHTIVRDWPRDRKTASCSTSTETSETSGFGSLGDDHSHVGSAHSGDHLHDDFFPLSEGKDDEISSESEEGEGASSSSLSSKRLSGMNSNDGGKSNSGRHSVRTGVKINKNNENDGEHDDGYDDEDDEMEEEGWMDIEDDDDDDQTSNQKAASRSHSEDDGDDSLSLSEGVTTGDSVEAGRDEDRDENVEEKPPVLPPSGFTVFLKKQVDTLPIPNTMKTYICHFR